MRGETMYHLRGNRVNYAVALYHIVATAYNSRGNREIHALTALFTWLLVPYTRQPRNVHAPTAELTRQLRYLRSRCGHLCSGIRHLGWHSDHGQLGLDTLGLGTYSGNGDQQKFQVAYRQLRLGTLGFGT